MKLPVDHDQRMAALDPLRSMCVTAPAGSGKTELLSQRVLKLLARVDQPEQILAITFTRKAAAEMHQRIIQSLLFAQQSEAPEQAHQLLTWQLAREALARNDSCNWQLLENTNRLQIQTIDSLCASLTRRMPVLSNFGAQPQISQQPERHYRVAVHNLLQQLESNSTVSDDLAKLLGHLDNDMNRAERLLIELLMKRDQWLLYIGIGQSSDSAKIKLEATLQQIVVDVLAQLRQLLHPFSPELLPLFDYAGCNMQWQNSDSSITKLAGIIELPPANLAAIDQWHAIADVLLTQTNGWRKTVNKNNGFPTETEDGDKVLAKELKNNLLAVLLNLRSNNGLLQSLTELRHLPAAQYNQTQWQLLDAMTRLLPLLVAELTLVFQQQGEVDYSQISMAALQALGEGLNPSELAMKLDYTLNHILVDEFQDTASTQFQLLQRLVEGWQEHNIDNPQRPNTLFIVGDGMQSIYGFRQANVGLFLEARNKGVNGIELDALYLTVNFRSDPIIVDWINQTFNQAFPEIENLARGAVPFEQAHAFNPSDINSEVKILAFSSEKSRIEEADEVVKLILQAQQSNPEGSIAVLVRSRSHLQDIIPALLAAGLDWNAADIDPLASYGFIQDIVSLTKALTNIADRISWTALLRTPWMGFNNSDLLLLLLANRDDHSLWAAIIEQQSLSSLSAHANSRLQEFIIIITAALQQRNRLSLRSWIEGVWLALGGAASLASVEEFKLVDDYFDLLEHYQLGEMSLNIDEFEQAVLHLFAAPNPTGSTIHLMTIHKSKGLEFDTVILPGLTRKPRSDDKSLLMWREYISSATTHVSGSHTGVVISPISAVGGDDRLYQHLRFEQSQTSVLENTRLFYVAATRAIKQLYLLVCTEKNEETSEAKTPNKHCLIASAWGPMQSQLEWVNTYITTPISSIPSSNDQFGLDFNESLLTAEYTRLPSCWQPPVWRFSNPLEGFYLQTETEDGLNRPELNVDPVPSCVGIVCHWVFEELVSQGIDFWLNMVAEKKQQWLQSLLHYHALPQDKMKEAIEQLILAVDNTINDDKGRWILSVEHNDSTTELALLSNFSGEVKQRIIDRSFMDDQGDYWIIDYKTSVPHSGESLEQFVEREADSYRAQLLDYKILLSNLLQANGQQPIQVTTIKIRTALYFTYFPYFYELVF